MTYTVLIEHKAPERSDKAWIPVDFPKQHMTEAEAIVYAMKIMQEEMSYGLDCKVTVSAESD